MGMSGDRWILVLFVFVALSALSQGKKKNKNRLNSTTVALSNGDLKAAELHHTVYYDSPIKLDLDLTVPNSKLSCEVMIDNANIQDLAEDYPVSFTLFGPHSAISWTLPYTVDGVTFYSIKKTLCAGPELDDFLANQPQVNNRRNRQRVRGPKLENVSRLTVVGYSHTPQSSPISLMVKPKRDDIVNSILNPSVAKSFSKISPNRPLVLYLNFPANAQMIRVSLTSYTQVGDKAQPELMCGLVVFQKNECPLLDSISAAKSALMFGTFRKKGTFVVQRPADSSNLAMILMTFAEDSRCGGTERTTPRNENQGKNVKVLMTAVPDDNYVLPVALFLGVFALFFTDILWPFGCFLYRKCCASPVESVPKVETVPLRPNGVYHDAVGNRPNSPQQLITIGSTSSEAAQSELIDISSVVGGSSTVPLLPLLQNGKVPKVSVTDNNRIADVTETTAGSKVAEGRDAGDLTGNHLDVDVEAKKIQLLAVSGSDTSEILFDRRWQNSSPIPETSQGKRFRRQTRQHKGTNSFTRTQFLMGIFYALPILQLVLAYNEWHKNHGDVDLCFHNFECIKPLGGFTAFNNIFSNLGFILLAFRFALTVRWRQLTEAGQMSIREEDCHQPTIELGLPPHYDILFGMAIAMGQVGVLSCLYHMCPNATYFQFDSTCMFATAFLVMLSLYSKRHPKASADLVYFVLFALLIFVGIGAMFTHTVAVWVVMAILDLLLVPFLCFHLYWGDEKETDPNAHKPTVSRVCFLIKTWWTTRGASGSRLPTYGKRFLWLLMINAVNVLLNLYGAITERTSIPTWLLFTFLVHTLLYCGYYFMSKVSLGEKILLKTWVYLAAAVVFCSAALVFYFHEVTNWSVTPAQSRELNSPCLLLNFFDSHDLWHMLSAVGMFFLFSSVMTIDDGVRQIPRQDIAVF